MNKAKTVPRPSGSGSSDVIQRFVLLLIGAGLIIFPVYLMLHGEFTFYDGVRRGWIFAPPLIFFGAAAIYQSLRKNKTARRIEDDSTDSENATDHSKSATPRN